MSHKIYPTFIRYVAAGNLMLSACAHNGTTQPETPASHNADSGSAPTNQAVPNHLPHGHLATMDTSCGMEVAMQAGTHFVRGRLPIAGLRQQTEGEAVFEGALIGIELFTRDAKDLAVSAVRGAQLLLPFRQSQLERASREAPELVSTTRTLALTDASPENLVDHWELESRDVSKKREYVDGLARIYTTVAVDDLVFAIVTYALPDDSNVLDVHAGFVKTLRIEAGALDLPALQGALQQRSERDPECREDPTVIRVEEVSEP